MDLKEVLFMRKGDGENSYIQNTPFTERVVKLSQPVLENAVRSLYREGTANEVLNVVDLGCSSGPCTFSVMSTVIEKVQKECEELNCQIPEFQFYLNDLPGNDFNTLFKGLSSFCVSYKDVSLFIMGAPGSFYGRLFPSISLHLVYSSYAVHWISKVPRLTDETGLPLNKGKICLSETSPRAVKEAYLAQFQEDFALFLKARSQEMVPNGRLVLVFQGRSHAEFKREECHPWEPLADAIAALVSEGMIEEEKLDLFNMPYYTPSQDEVKDLVNKEGSFAIELLDAFSTEVGDKSVWDNAQKLSTSTRSYTESVISHQFGEEILDKLYDKFTQIITKHWASNQQPYKIITLMIALRRN